MPSTTYRAAGLAQREKAAFLAMGAYGPKDLARVVSVGNAADNRALAHRRLAAMKAAIVDAGVAAAILGGCAGGVAPDPRVDPPPPIVAQDPRVDPPPPIVAQDPRVDPPPPVVAPAEAAAPEKPVITTVQAGLSAEHRGQRPLLDRIALQSHGRVRGTRIYEDGTQYLILSDPAEPGAGDLAWSRFVRVTRAGVERLREVIRESVLPYDGAPPSAAGPTGDAGTITWIVNMDGRERVVQTAAGNYGTLPAFVRQLDEAVSQNVQPAD